MTFDDFSEQILCWLVSCASRPPKPQSQQSPHASPELQLMLVPQVKTSRFLQNLTLTEIVTASTSSTVLSKVAAGHWRAELGRRIMFFFAFWEYPEPHKYLATPILTFTAHDSQRKGWHCIYISCFVACRIVSSNLICWFSQTHPITSHGLGEKNRILTPTAMVLGATVKFSMPFSVTKTLSYCCHRVSGASDRGSEICQVIENECITCAL